MGPLLRRRFTFRTAWVEGWVARRVIDWEPRVIPGGDCIIIHWSNIFSCDSIHIHRHRILSLSRVAKAGIDITF